jgi:signal peptidase II
VSDNSLRARVLAAKAILAVFAADQAVKWILLSCAVGLNGATLIPGFLSVRFTWNRGVSFGLFWQDSDVGSLLLFAGTALIVAVLSVWAYRTQRTRVAVAIGFIIGGALGNLVDRYFDHAVFDFLVLRLGEITLHLQFGGCVDHARYSRPALRIAMVRTQP